METHRDLAAEADELWQARTVTMSKLSETTNINQDEDVLNAMRYSKNVSEQRRQSNNPAKMRAKGNLDGLYVLHKKYGKKARYCKNTETCTWSENR